MIRLSPFALAGALLATSVTVLGTYPAQAAVRHVSYADLDLTSAAGRAAMDARLSKAASSVCLAENRELSLAAVCHRESMERARADLSRAIHDNAVQVAVR